jgi:hypothetical protein
MPWVLHTYRPSAQPPGYREVRAAHDNGDWKTDDLEFLPILECFHLPPGYFPDRDRALLEMVQRAYGGEIRGDGGRRTAPPDAVF